MHHDGPYEHTSILKFIEWRWGLEPLTMRDANAKNIGEAFDWSQTPRTQIGLVQMETPSFYASSSCASPEPAEANDFQRLADSRFLRSLGITVAQPDPDTVFNNASGAPTVVGQTAGAGAAGVGSAITSRR